MSDTTPTLSANALRKSFSLPQGKLEVLRGLDFSISPGSSASIRGESGSGKSTLLNLFGGLEKPDSGEIRWMGESIQKFSVRKLARERGRRLGMVFQAYHLIGEMTALENVLFAGRMVGKIDETAKERGIQLLEKVGLGDRLKQLPAKMSGGERQRVAIARSILNQPKILLADEPTGNLDEKTGQATMELLMELVQNEGISLILVTHNPSFARLCDFQWKLTSGALEETSDEGGVS